jgi:hypothetical protein
MMNRLETEGRRLKEEEDSAFLQPTASSLKPVFDPLDIAACYGTGFTAKAISCGTASLLAPPRLKIGPSHVATFCEYQQQTLWIESTTLCPHPCEITGRPINGCQAHHPETRIADYLADGGRVDLYRLSPIEKLSKDERELLSRILIRHFVGRAVTYDLGGALLSGTRLFKRTRLLPSADLNELFCSELVAAVCMRLGRMNRSNPTQFNPACLLRELVRNGTYQFHHSFTKESL